LQDNKLIITIDGPSASGKGAISKIIAEKYSCVYLDTGKLYRGLAKLIIAHELMDNYKESLNLLCQKIDNNLLDDPSLQDDEISNFSSIIAADIQVREALYEFQRNFINENLRIVLDGRDTGSIICPEANYKFYVKADIKIRSKRRYLQNIDYYKRKNISLEKLENNLALRDKRDSERKNAPLIIPDGAFVICNNSNEINDIFFLL
jgi:cytidylate kinase